MRVGAWLYGAQIVACEGMLAGGALCAHTPNLVPGTYGQGEYLLLNCCWWLNLLFLLCQETPLSKSISGVSVELPSILIHPGVSSENYLIGMYVTVRNNPCVNSINVTIVEIQENLAGWLWASLMLFCLWCYNQTALTLLRVWQPLITLTSRLSGFSPELHCTP